MAEGIFLISQIEEHVSDKGQTDVGIWIFEHG